MGEGLLSLAWNLLTLKGKQLRKESVLTFFYPGLRMWQINANWWHWILDQLLAAVWMKLNELSNTFNYRMNLFCRWVGLYDERMLNLWIWMYLFAEWMIDDVKEHIHFQIKWNQLGSKLNEIVFIAIRQPNLYYYFFNNIKVQKHFS